MSKTIRQAKRERQKAKRKQSRKQTRNKTARKAGSIAIHSRLPGLEGTEIGAMDVIVDTRRKETHPSELSVSVHSHGDQRTVTWSIETGFGGLSPKVGFQVLPDDKLDDVPPITWLTELLGVEHHDSAGLLDSMSPADGDTCGREHGGIHRETPQAVRFGR